MKTLLTSLLLGAATLLHAQPLPEPAAVAAEADRLLAARVGADGPGIVGLVARGDQVLWRGARGLASVELGVPLAPTMSLRIGSVTKQIAAAALLQQVDAGRLALTDPLSRWLPDYPNAGAITVAQLLNHSSGVKSYTGIPGYMDQPVRRDLDTAALIREFRDLPADFPPGSAFRYNNSGYVLAGAVLEAVTGRPWHEAVAAMLQPLGVPGIRWGGDPRPVPGMAEGYSAGPGGELRRAGMISMTQPHAAGALLGTVDGLWRWSRALHDGRVLKPETYRRMVTPEGAAAAAGYGYGIAAGPVRGEAALRHGGGIHGYTSVLLELPGPRITVVLLRNSDTPGGVLDPLAQQLAAIALGRPYPDGPTVEVPAAELQRLAGRWRLQGGDAERMLRVQGGTLVSQRGAGPVFTLRPIAGGRWLFEGSLARFEPEPGPGLRMRLFQGGEGEGEVWERVGD